MAGAPEGRSNLLLVMVNCLSKSHLPLYGYRDASTPNLDRFARDAYVFRNLVSPASFTPPVLQELFSSAPLGRDFYLGVGWNEWSPNEFERYPIIRSLADQGYVFTMDRLPDDAGKPFVSFFHICTLHYPYDQLRRREIELRGEVRRLYRRIVKDLDEIKLVEKPADTEKFPALREFQAFGVRRTELPVGDAVLWNGLLQSLRSSGDSPSAVVARALPSRLLRRLALVGGASDLTLRDKAAIVRALNDLTRDPRSPVGEVLFGARSSFNSGNLTIGGSTVTRWDWQFVADIERAMLEPNNIILLKDNGRMELAGPLDRHQRLFLRQIYRETLEFLFPALTLHHTQRFFIAPSEDVLRVWRDSPDYETDLALFRALYDANISEVDRQFGAALEGLRRLGAQDNTVVAFMGDHGEGFMERGYLEHGMAKCYDDEISPPLLIRVPGRLRDMLVVETQLRIADVFPTLIELMGLQTPVKSAAPAGISLASALDGGPHPGITAFSRNYDFSRSIRRHDGWKLIWEMGTNLRELYNWKNDPGEVHNAIEDHPAIAAELEEQLNRFLYGD